jgi:hypothetical protein
MVSHQEIAKLLIILKVVMQIMMEISGIAEVLKLCKLRLLFSMFPFSLLENESSIYVLIVQSYVDSNEVIK